MKVNMSDFLGGRVIKYINGEPMVEEKKLNGDIEIKELNGYLLEKINSEVISKITDEELKDDEYVTYLLFPYITNINMDVDKETFLGILKFPKPQFAIVFKMIMEEINSMFESAQKISEIKEDINKLVEQNTMIKDNIELMNFENEQKLKKSKEDEIEELMERLPKVKDNPEERRNILKRINELENSI